MKTNIHFKTTVVILLGAFTLLFNNLAVAGNDEKNSNKFVQLQYAGKADDQPMFRLAISDKSAADYIVTIKELNGDVLFTEKLSGNVSRTYKLDSDDTERIMATIFEVTNRNTGATTIYRISQLTQTVENVVVSRS